MPAVPSSDQSTIQLTKIYHELTGLGNVGQRTDVYDATIGSLRRETKGGAILSYQSSLPRNILHHSQLGDVGQSEAGERSLSPLSQSIDSANTRALTL